MDKKIKIVFVCGWYSSPFGYIHNNLPKALAKVGHDVHIVTSVSQQYSNTPTYESTYESFLGPKYTKEGITIEENVRIHRLPVGRFKTEIYPKYLYKKLRELNPDIVHIFDISCLLSFKLALYKPFFKYKYINSNHILMSVFPLHAKWKKLNVFAKLKWFLLHKVPGRFIYKQTDFTIYPTVDAKNLALTYFGFKDKKNTIQSLAVDINIFKSLPETEIIQTNAKLGFEKSDFICVYTGRFSEDKDPLQLAKAVQQLNVKYPTIKGLFVGSGVQDEEINKIPNCVIVPFASQLELSQYYNIAAIGIWPKQESTSMLDCLACKTPIIVNDTVKATERVDGNGILFEYNNLDSLCDAIEKLYLDNKLLLLYGKAGQMKVVNNFSWTKYASGYLQTISYKNI